MKCPYCNQEAHQVGGAAIYPHRPDLYAKKFYQCVPCDAYVGCHPGTTTPLGRLANAELRKAKSEAHLAFDPMWKSKKMSRHAAYIWLAAKLGIKPADCHIGMFDAHDCHRVIETCAGCARPTGSYLWLNKENT